MNKILQLNEVPLSYLKQTHLVGLMTFTRDQFAASFTTEKPAPAKLQAQIAAFNAAYADLDAAYRADSYSLDTDELKNADKECDSIFMSIKKMVQAQQSFDFNPELKAAANRLMQAIDKFGIDVSEDYLGENNKLQQLLQEIAESTQLTADAKALGLEAAIAQLKEKAALVRQLLTTRGLAKAPKGHMKQARQAVEQEYRRDQNENDAQHQRRAVLVPLKTGPHENVVRQPQGLHVDGAIFACRVHSLFSPG